MSAPSQDGVKFNDIIPLLWVTLKQSAAGVVVFSRKEAPSTSAPRLFSQLTRREFRNRSFMFSSSDVEASGTHASSIAKTHPTAAPEEERMLISVHCLNLIELKPI